MTLVPALPVGDEADGVIPLGDDFGRIDKLRFVELSQTLRLRSLLTSSMSRSL
jgi:hypothetical protein